MCWTTGIRAPGRRRPQPGHVTSTAAQKLSQSLRAVPQFAEGDRRVIHRVQLRYHGLGPFDRQSLLISILVAAAKWPCAIRAPMCDGWNWETQVCSQQLKTVPPFAIAQGERDIEREADSIVGREARAKAAIAPRPRFPESRCLGQTVRIRHPSIRRANGPFSNRLCSARLNERMAWTVCGGEKAWQRVTRMCSSRPAQVTHCLFRHSATSLGSG